MLNVEEGWHKEKEMFVTLYYKKDTLHYKHINIGRKMGLMYIEKLAGICQYLLQ